MKYENSEIGKRLWQVAIQIAPNLAVYGFDVKVGGMEEDHLRINDRFFHQIAVCARWIDRRPRTKNVNRNGYGSYFYKHVVERESDEYIPNGAFIAAALALGCKWKRVGPNAVFNISRKCVLP